MKSFSPTVFPMLHCLYGGQVFWSHHSAVFTAVLCDAVVGRAPWVPSEDLQVPVLEQGVGQLVCVVIEDIRPELKVWSSVVRRAVPFVRHLHSTHRLVWFPLCCFPAVLVGELFQLPLFQPVPWCANLSLHVRFLTPTLPCFLPQWPSCPCTWSDAVAVALSECFLPRITPAYSLVGNIGSRLVWFCIAADGTQGPVHVSTCSAPTTAAP